MSALSKRQYGAATHPPLEYPLFFFFGLHLLLRHLLLGPVGYLDTELFVMRFLNSEDDRRRNNWRRDDSHLDVLVRRSTAGTVDSVVRSVAILVLVMFPTHEGNGILPAEVVDKHHVSMYRCYSVIAM